MLRPKRPGNPQGGMETDSRRCPGLMRPARRRAEESLKRAMEARFFASSTTTAGRTTRRSGPPNPEAAASRAELPPSSGGPPGSSGGSPGGGPSPPGQGPAWPRAFPRTGERTGRGRRGPIFPGGRVPLCRRDSTRPQNASDLTSIPPRNGFPAFLPSPLCPYLPRLPCPGGPRIGEAGLRDRVPVRPSPRASIRCPGDSRKRPARGKQGGVRRRGRPGSPRSVDRGPPRGRDFRSLWPQVSPQAGGPAAVRRSLPRRPKPSRNFIPAGDAGRRAAAHPRLAGACPNGAPSLFRSPPPSCRPLAPLAGGVEGARAPSSGLRPRPRPIPGGFAGDSRGSNPDPASPP
jgi:hypothetical protein